MVLVAAAPGAIVGNGFAIAADHTSRRVIAAIGAFGFALALCGYGFGHSFAILLVASFMVGMFATALIEATELALVDISGDDVDDNVARSMMWSSVGDLAGPALLILVTAGGFGWRPSFLVAALVFLAYGIWILTLPLPRPTAHPQLGRWHDAVREAWRTPAVWYVGIAAFLIGPLDESFLAFLIAKLERADGLSIGLATAIATATIVGNLIGFSLSPRLRPPSLPRNAAILAITAACCGLLPWFFVPWSALVFGIALARAWMAIKLRAIAIRPERRGTISAVVSTIEFTGFVLPLVAGVLADAYGLSAGLAFYVLIALALLAVAAQAKRARAI